MESPRWITVKEKRIVGDDMREPGNGFIRNVRGTAERERRLSARAEMIRTLTRSE
jgi:hypothetical protein